MIQQWLAKILLFPFTMLYGMVISMRNLMYDAGLLKSTRFSIPIISVGNLSIGGAGKTPHIEFLIEHLRPYLNIATLSRGYKRKTKGFRMANLNDNALTIGDEPLQYRRKYRDIIVSVSESRTLAIPLILKQAPGTQVVLLDDAFQHRAIVPGLNVLLTTYDQPFTRDILLPAGRLREYSDSYKRADIIIVSKCPEEISEQNRAEIIKEINLLDRQRLYFTKYHYHNPYSFFNPSSRIKLSNDADVILVSAIANTAYLRQHLDNEVASVHELEYEDHHIFLERDIEYMEQVYINRESSNKIILTTEKDAMRLELHRDLIYKKKLPVYVLPVEVSFLFDQKDEFINDIRSFLLNFKV
ncbi:MAG: tetraacyldisaccharide 4'-kinase [Saprospiraceae bacterium]|nr:tetraacyldisaccharide 4'-kinase [Saprospiraceae bacterium]